MRWGKWGEGGGVAVFSLIDKIHEANVQVKYT